MIERKHDRRYRMRDTMRLAPERRDGLDRRALPAIPGNAGMIRPGVGEARPPRERRWDMSGGME